LRKRVIQKALKGIELDRKYIKQLTLGGFQVFADPLTIPLGPLTLLYGPNSAGKSAILDAMLALADLCELCTSDQLDLAGIGLHPGAILERHWRREGDMQATPVDTLKLGASIRTGGLEWAVAGIAKHQIFGIGSRYPKFAECYSCLRPLVEAKELDVEVSFQYKLAKPKLPNVAHAVRVGEKLIKVGIGGLPILRWCESGRWASINLDHPSLLAWAAAIDIKWLAKRYLEVGAEEYFVHRGGWFIMTCCDVLNPSLSSEDRLTTNAIDAIENAPGVAQSPEEWDRLRGAVTAFLNMFDGLFVSCLRVMRNTLRVPVVPASRAVPRSSEVTFLFNRLGNQQSGGALGLMTNGLPEHLLLTRAAFFFELERCGLIEASTGLRKNPLDIVNGLLSNYLFQSSGYFVGARIHELTKLVETDGANMNTNVSDGTFLVTLELRDSSGRHFNFDEVGSGLGYVLPVLLAIGTADFAFIQQPELHLHPALQSELADALIVALSDVAFGGFQSKGCRQIIAETHSEHLLLRLLRRVRQAADPARSLDPHSLGREDLVVLYVDPKPDGTSKVKHLRITKDGEFMDRWPRGFFGERDLELLDDGK
jgi:hypothetical protein